MRRDLERIAQSVMDAVRDLPSDFQRGEELELGADGTPTCRIDKLAEDIILRYVIEQDLPVNLLSEEVGHLDRGADLTLVVDPIDGTNNSVMGIPYYSVSLAVGSRSMMDVSMALVRNLVTGTIYFSERGRGATRDGRPIEVRSFDPLHSLLLVYMGRWASVETMRVVKSVERARSLGCASLEMCLVADGTVDGYYMNCERFDKSIRVVDIAASALILREAGGELLDLDGRRLDMPFDLAVRSNFFAMGDPRSREVVLSG